MLACLITIIMMIMMIMIIIISIITIIINDDNDNNDNNDNDDKSSLLLLQHSHMVLCSHAGLRFLIRYRKQAGARSDKSHTI